jgi:hypothetical protein
MRNNILALVAAWAVAFVAAGQPAHAEWPKWWPGKAPPKVQESKYPTPIKMAVIWTPAVFNQVGQQSTRGFGGRIYFYDAKNQPVPVEGQLVVYAYNDAAPGGENRTPERKFAFTPEQFTQHYAPTQLGASYSIWIPWDAIGSPQAQLSLIPIFTSSSGQLVIGESSHNLLPGPEAPSGATQVTRGMLPPSPLIRPDPSAAENARRGFPPGGASNAYGVQQASYQPGAYPPVTSQPGTSPAAPPQAADGLSTMSITLPGSMADQLAGATPQAGPVERLAIQRATLAASRMAANGGQNMQPQNMQQPSAATAPKPPAPVAAAVPPWMTVVPPPVRYGPPSPQAPIAPVPQPTVGQHPSVPFPAGQPSVLPATR